MAGTNSEDTAFHRNCRFYVQPGDPGEEVQKAVRNENRVIPYMISLAAAASLLLASLLAAAASVQKMNLDCIDLKPGEPMPKRYRADGKELSPPLTWSLAPRDTHELALVFESLEDGKVLWLLYRIPSKATGLKAGLPSDVVLKSPQQISGTIQGLTSFRLPGYHGPQLVSGKEGRYRFTLYAIDAHLGLLPGLDKASLMALIQDHIVGEGTLTVICR